MMNAQDTQFNIVKFLSGETVQMNLSIDPREGKPYLAQRGLEVGLHYEQTMKRIHTVFVEEFGQTLDENAFPSTCKGCGSFELKADSYRDVMRDAHCFSVKVGCKRHGCNEAGNKFIENFMQLKSKGKAFIKFEASESLDETTEAHSVMSGGLYITPFAKSSSRIEFSDPIKVKPDEAGVKGAGFSDHRYAEDFFSTGQYVSYKDAAPSKKRKTRDTAPSKEQQEQEIADLLALEVPSISDRYGVAAW